MSEPLDVARPEGRGRRRWRWVVGIGTPLLVVLAVAAFYFQPWKLFIDKTVDDAAPLGATPIAAVAEPASPPTTEAMTETTEPMTEATEPMTAPSAETTVAPTTVPPTTAAPTTTTAPVPVPTMFISLDHGTSGSLLLLQDPDGRRYARIENLATDQGPDVFVYLSTNPVDGPEEAFDDDYVNLGGLQGNLGNQNYEIPADTDVSRYRSLVIWCDRFDSAFGAAPLPS